MSAELAARRTAAAAVLADYASVHQRRRRRGPGTVGRPARRHADAAARRAGGQARAGAAEQLEEIRLVLEAFDWETDDRQYALEQIDGIVKGDGQ